MPPLPNKARMGAAALEKGYWQAYGDFYRWESIWQGAMNKPDWHGRLRHIAYAGGWKKFEPFWDMVIRLKQVGYSRPLLEHILSGFGSLRLDKTGRAKPDLTDAGPPRLNVNSVYDPIEV